MRCGKGHVRGKEGERLRAWAGVGEIEERFCVGWESEGGGDCEAKGGIEVGRCGEVGDGNDSGEKLGGRGQLARLEGGIG